MFPSRIHGARRGARPIFPRLTDADYDALYVAVHKQMPRVTRQMFPVALQQLVGSSVLEINTTAHVISVRIPGVPEIGTYRVRRIRNRARNRQL